MTAEKVRNAYQGLGKRYKTLLETCEAFNDALKARIGVDRSKHTWERYKTVATHLSSFMQAKYRDSGRADKVFPMTQLRATNRALLQIGRACGIEKHITFHLARHTFATTICLMNEVTLETLSKMMGHKNITTTQIYAKITAPMIDRAMTQLAGRIGDKYAG